MIRSVTIYTFLLMAFLVVNAKGQSLSWTLIEYLEDSLRAKPKPIMVFIHTDWCKYCKMQEKVTFNDQELINLLNRDFYSVKLDAEGEIDLKFMGRTYKGGSSKDYHELSKMLGMKNGKLLFPTTVFYSPTSQGLSKFQGFQQAGDLKAIIKKFEAGI